jgi:hypothetical protein
VAAALGVVFVGLGLGVIMQKQNWMAVQIYQNTSVNKTEIGRLRLRAPSPLLSVSHLYQASVPSI